MNIQRFTIGVFAVGTIMAGVTLPAFQKPNRDPIPDFDKRRAPAAPAAPAAAQARAGGRGQVPEDKASGLARLRARVPNVRVDFDPVIGSPRSINAPDGFLTGPRGVGRTLPGEATARFAEMEPYRVTKAFLDEHRGLFGHGAEVLTKARVKRDDVTAHNGVRTTAWEQELDGIPLFESMLLSHCTRKEELISLASQFVPDPEQAANAGALEPARRQVPVIPGRQAVVQAAQSLGEEVSLETIQPVDPPAGAEQKQQFKAAPFNEIEARLVWLPMSRALLRLCWDVRLASRARGETFRLLVDAQTGEVLLRRCLTVYLSDATYRVFTSDSPSPFSPGHGTPSTNQPPLVARSLVTLAALDATASPNGWIDDGVNETCGNNVDAHLDRNADDNPDLPRPQGAPLRVFDFPLDLGQAPTTYGNAAVVQLFYWCNWMHDQTYSLGFTEAAGNHQNETFGRGGRGGDAISVDAQDGSGFNNANYTPTPDGTPARIQMYLFDGPTPDRDGDLDAEIVLHEYTHGVSDRLVGGGVGIGALQTGGLGEGWSDFLAIGLLSESGDDPGGNWAAGGYLTYRFFGLGENYYYGIRRYPYTTNLLRNPLTLKDIDPDQAQAHPEAPLSPLGRPFNPGEASEVHNQGEVWCVTLWEVRANLIARHGFAVGNRLMLQLVIDGMKLAPPNPNFLEARDGILMADRVNNGAANYLDIWRGFAKRGMGFNATSPGSDTTRGVEESFDLPDDLLVSPRSGFTASGPVGGPFSITAQTYSLTNVGSNSLRWSLINTSLWLVASPTDGTLEPGGPDEEVAVTLAAAANLLPMGIYRDTLLFLNQTSGIAQARQFTLRVGQPDYFTELFGPNGNDLAFQMFTFTPDGSASFYSVCREPATEFPTDPAGGTVLTLSDDAFVAVTLSGGADVSLYGRRTNAFFIGSNGYLTLEEGDLRFTESLAGHFDLPRVAALFDDLDPLLAGTISWKRLSNRVAVTWFEVPEFGAPGRRNSFQTEWFFDGRIRLTYLEIGSGDGLVGLSAGLGQPEAIEASDFSAYGACAAPLLARVPASAGEGDGVLAGAGQVWLTAPATNDLVVALTSSDVSEVTVPTTVTIPMGRTNVTFDLTIADDADLDGTQTATITAAAPGYNGRPVAIAVHDNETATLSVTAPPSAREGDGAVAGLVHLSAAPATSVLVGLFSSDELEVRVPAGVIVPAGQTSASFNLIIVDDTRIDGPQDVTLTARVQNWTDGSASLTVQDNESLDLAVVLPPFAVEGDGVLSNAGLVRLAGTLPTNLVIDLASADTTELTVPSKAVIPAGQVSGAFDLNIVDDSAVDSNQVATVTASAPGFVSGSASLTVLDDESPPAPSNPRPPHLATNVAANIDLAWSNTRGEVILNGGFESGDFAGWTRVNRGNGDFVINDGTFDPDGPDGPLPPFAERFAAVTRQSGPGQHTIYQDVRLPVSGTPVLDWAQRIRNHASEFATNQYFRVEVRDASNAVLAVAFSTQPGDPLLGDWTEQSFDLSAFRGRTVRIAFVEEDNLNFFNAHVDEVRVTGAVTGGTITNDVYFGTNAAPGPPEYVGTTTNPTWDLPLLAPDTTYYWQIVSRRTGVSPGPVWQFTTRGLDHFEWDPVPSPQVVNEPFPVTIRAVDEFGTTVSRFDGAVGLRALEEGTIAELFADDFEDGDLAGWTPGFGFYTREVTTNTAAGGARSLTLLGGNGAHFDGLSQALPHLTPRRATFWVRSDDSTRAGGYFVTGDGSEVDRSIVFFLMTDDGRMGLVDDLGVHAVPYQAGRWYKITLEFSWDTRTVDYFVDDVLAEAGIRFRSLTAEALEVIALYNFDNTQSWWDEIVLESADPAQIGVAPTNSDNFVQGVWSGQVAVLAPAGSVRLEARDNAGHRGVSNPFLVSVRNDVSVSVSAAPDPATAGNPLTYTVRVVNTGPTGANGVTLTNFLPANVDLIAFNSSVGACSLAGSEIQCAFGSLAGGDGATVTIEVRPRLAGGILTNRADIARVDTDAYLPNNSAIALTTVRPPEVNIADRNLPEADSGSSLGYFVLWLSVPSIQPVSVNAATSDGTALAFDDYALGSTRVTFSPGIVTQRVSVAILGDRVAESNETFFVQLSDPHNAVLGRARAIGTILDDDAQMAASLPFAEDWESGAFRPFWFVSGTPGGRAHLSFGDAPQGSYHLLLDDGLPDAMAARNEVTLLVNLANYTNVALRFQAVGFNDEPHGPPPAPFEGGADFDGVAVSADGVHWYEVQPLRNLAGSYSEFVVDLDAAIAAHGLDYTPNFRLRFNQYDDQGVPSDGIGLDAIFLTGTRIGILPFGAMLVAEACTPANQVVDPGEAVTVELVLTNFSSPPAGNVVATLLEANGVLAPSGPRDYGVLVSGGVSATNTFTFIANGPCGGTVRPTLWLQDGARDLGMAEFSLTLGASSSALRSLANPATVILSDSGPAIPYPSTINVSGRTGLVNRVTVTLSNLTHTFPADIDVLLVNPANQAVALLSDAGGGLPVTNVVLTFDDDAPAPAPPTDQLITGTYRPSNYEPDSFPSPAPSGPYATSLAGFKGANPNGAWRLFVVDDIGGHSGTIRGWHLTISTATSSCCLDSASADLALGVATRPDTAVVGNTVTNTIAVTNRGPAAANNVVVSQPLPPDVMLVSASSTRGTCALAGDTVICSLGSMDNNSTATITVRLRPTTVGAVTHTASVSAAPPDYNLFNNVASALTTVVLPTLNVLDANVTEGNTTVLDLQFQVRLSASNSVPVSVSFATSDLSAQVGLDYRPTNGVLVFAAGEISKFIRVAVLPDLLDEDNETLFLDLFDLNDAQAGDLAAIGTIIDNDPSPALAISDATVVEGRSGTTNALFSVTLSAPSSRLVFADFATANVSAVAPADYMATDGQVFFDPGETNMFIAVPIFGDALNEANEVFLINLSSPFNATLADAQGQGRILNDDFLATIVIASSALVAEDCAPANGAVDPGETVTLRLALRNASAGGAIASNVVVSLLPTGGVVNPSGSRRYGLLPANGPVVTNFFSFTVNRPCGANLALALHLRDDANDLGPISLILPVGRGGGLTENFDGVTPPGLPAGWTTRASGAGVPWATTTNPADSIPNSVFVPDPTSVSEMLLVSPPVPVDTPDAPLSFRYRYETEFCCDGGSLEISIDAGPFHDLVAAGGSFVTNGYNGFAGGREAWVGDSFGFIPTIAILPPATAGHTVQLQWRFTSDSSIGDMGWFVDSIVLAGRAICCGSDTPAPIIQSITYAGGVVTVTWSALAGRAYRLQFKDDLTMPGWSDLPGEVTTAGDLAAKTDMPGAAEQRFYRVLLMP